MAYHNRDATVTPQANNSDAGENNADRNELALEGVFEDRKRLREAINRIVINVRGLAAKKKTIFRLLIYFSIIIAVGVGLMILDYYVPTPHLVSILPLSFVFIGVVFIVWLCYRHCGRARWALNWRLKKSSRYLDVCQVSDEYVRELLPQLSPEAQRVCYCRLAGSSGDGYGFFPSLGANVGVCSNKQYLTQDVDVNMFYKNLPLTKEDLVTEGLPPGFCWIRLDSKMETLDSFVRDCIVTHPTLRGSYLSGKRVSDKIGQYIPNDVEYNYPALTYTNVLDGPQGQYNFDVDVVFGIKITEWPDAASEWSTSENRHLAQETITNIVKRGCYVVHKHCVMDNDSFTLKHQEHNLDWRFTFAEAETELFKYHSDKEALKLCYVIIKFCLKISSTNRGKTLPALKSYHLKTLFLRIAESESERFDMLKIKNNCDLGPLFMFILSEYKSALQQKSLPHYFMPSINILQQYTEEELNEGISVLDEFERRPLLVIDVFDKVWIDRRKMDWFLIIAVFIMLLCFGMKIYFENRSENLFRESNTLFSESKAAFVKLLGERHRDLLYLADDPQELLKFYRCYNEQFNLEFGGDRRRRDLESVPGTGQLPTTTSFLFSFTYDVLKERAISQCRIQLNLGLPKSNIE